MSTEVCSVTSEPSQSSSRQVLFFKDSSELLNPWEVNIWNGSLVTLYTFVFIIMTFVLNPGHIFMASSRASESCLMAELCYHHFVHLVVFRYRFLAFTTSSVLAIRRSSILWGSPLRCSVVLMSPWLVKRACYCSEIIC